MNLDICMKKYAELLITYAVALNKDQYFVLEIQAEQVEFARYLSEEAMKQGAKDVIVFFKDDYIDKSRVLYGNNKNFKNIQRGIDIDMNYYLDNNGASLSLISPRPQINDDLNIQKSTLLASYYNNVRNIVRKYILKKNINWCYACVPNYDWAKFIYPELSREKAYKKLWNTLIEIYLISDDSVKNAKERWITLSDKRYKYTNLLNSFKLDKIHFYNSIGTDFIVGINPKIKWSGGESKEEYNPKKGRCNLPSYEIETSPDYTRTEGKVYSSMPLYLNGNIIDKFWFEFKEGKVINFGAEKGYEILEYLLNVDEGSKYLGEVAFVENDLPIGKTGIIFYNTLLDENARCHLALGQGFPDLVDGLDVNDTEAILKEKINISSQHIDFMFGTDDLNADGYNKEGEKIILMKNGKFQFC